jgi:hypothetical protein
VKPGLIHGVAALMLAGATTPVAAQWSVAPSLAVGLAIPGTRQDRLGEGPVAKAGLWMRAPRFPLGITAEGMVTSKPHRETMTPTDDRFTIAGATLNVTTRRHAARLEPYGIVGGGWYWYNNVDGQFTRTHAPGLNVGVGELLEWHGHDLFIELRLHALRTPMMTGTVWTTTLPIMLGMRF